MIQSDVLAFKNEYIKPIVGNTFFPLYITYCKTEGPDKNEIIYFDYEKQGFEFRKLKLRSKTLLYFKETNIKKNILILIYKEEFYKLCKQATIDDL